MSNELTKPSLSVVGQGGTVAERVRALQAEARKLARSHTEAWVLALEDAARMGNEIAEGGDAYPAGVRDLARRFALDVEVLAQNVTSISGRKP